MKNVGKVKTNNGWQNNKSIKEINTNSYFNKKKTL